MALLRMIFMCFFITVIPCVIGYGLAPVKQKGERLLLGWVTGQCFLWTLFLLICMPLTLAKRSFTEVLILYGVICVGIVIFSLILFWVKGRKERKQMAESGMAQVAQTPQNASKRVFKGVALLWIVAALLLVIQLLCIFLLAYEEGDDAYYVAITTMSRDADRLYTKIPYTGAFTELTARYALAPFPVWVAALARIGGLSGAVTAHLVMPVFVLMLAYGIYYLIGKKLLSGMEQTWVMPLYLILVELLVIFGGYSTYSKENFLVVRAGQGKAVLANIIIPMVFYFLFYIMERLEQAEKPGFYPWLQLILALGAGCLCSSLGSFLLCLFLGLGVLLCALVYRRFRLILSLIPCMILPAVIMLLYIAF